MLEHLQVYRARARSLLNFASILGVATAVHSIAHGSTRFNKLRMVKRLMLCTNIEGHRAVKTGSGLAPPSCIRLDRESSFSLGEQRQGGLLEPLNMRQATERTATENQLYTSTRMTIQSKGVSQLCNCYFANNRCNNKLTFRSGPTTHILFTLLVPREVQWIGIAGDDLVPSEALTFFYLARDVRTRTILEMYCLENS